MKGIKQKTQVHESHMSGSLVDLGLSLRHAESSV